MAIENGLRERLLSGKADRQTIIHFPNGEYADITGGFYSGSLSLEEILCSSEVLTFGECNASKFEATISGIPDISNKIIYAYQVIPFDESKNKVIVDYSNKEIITYDGKSILVGRHSDYIIPLFYGRVDSAKLKTDRTYREIIAYDELYFQGDTNCADWYSDFFADGTTKTLKDFRDSLFAFIGIEQEDTVLPNDGMIVEETLSTTELKFSDVLKAICQINGCFGHIARNGIFKYVFLNNSCECFDVSDNYRSNDTTFESYTVKKIDKIQVNGEEGDIGAIVGTGDNPYIIQGNFLVWGKGADELNDVATNVLNTIKDIEYRPTSVKLIYSEPYITVGNSLNLVTRRDGTIINTYVLHNTFESVQLFSQTMMSEGSEYRDDVVDDVNAEINQLKGKTLKLTKNVEEFSVEMTNIYGQIDNLTTEYSLIKQQSDSIVLEVGEINQDLSNKVDIGKVSSQLSIEKDQITITGNRLVIEANNFELNNEGSILSGDIAGGKYIELNTGVLSAHNNGVEIFRLNASNGEGSLFLSSNDGNGSLSFISNTDVLIAGTNYAKASEIITTNSRLVIGGSDCYHIFIDLYGTRVMDIEDNQVTINADLYVNGTKIG